MDAMSSRLSPIKDYVNIKCKLNDNKRNSYTLLVQQQQYANLVLENWT